MFFTLFVISFTIDIIYCFWYFYNIKIYYRGETTEYNKLLSADCDEWQYLGRAMEFWVSRGSGNGQPVDSDNRYSVLEKIVDNDIQESVFQQVGYSITAFVCI